jgi:hypothetical protein
MDMRVSTMICKNEQLVDFASLSIGKTDTNEVERLAVTTVSSRPIHGPSNFTADTDNFNVCVT